MLNDTFASMRRLLIGTGLAAGTALLLGLNIGLFPGINAALNPFITFISMIPPLLIEKEKELGGDCLHFGCVPSKTLIKSAHV
ncbi:MAG: hypothetical protein D3924_19445, partial [Candidatus Electrothrix sp. AR4]|nr:hypothetical protein [Candidatus Electrothrix sp. AR4]